MGIYSRVEQIILLGHFLWITIPNVFLYAFSFIPIFVSIQIQKSCPFASCIPFRFYSIQCGIRCVCLCARFLSFVPFRLLFLPFASDKLVPHIGIAYNHRIPISLCSLSFVFFCSASFVSFPFLSGLS